MQWTGCGGRGIADLPVPLAAQAGAIPPLLAMTTAPAGRRKATLGPDATIAPGVDEDARCTTRSANGTRPGAEGNKTLNGFPARGGSMHCRDTRDHDMPEAEENALLSGKSPVVPRALTEGNKGTAGRARELRETIFRAKSTPGTPRTSDPTGGNSHSASEFCPDDRKPALQSVPTAGPATMKWRKQQRFMR